MKRTVVFLASLFILALAATSCSTSKDCPAYGEAQHHQKSSRR